MRNRFDKQLEELGIELTRMGARIEDAIRFATKALTGQDPAAAELALEADSEIDELEKDIEQRCFKLLLHEQPVASDLRLVSSALKMITDMERIGDQAADITELAMAMAGRGQAENLDLVPKMAEATIKMVTGSVEAFVRKDKELAVSVCESDDVVDSLFNRVKDDIVGMIRGDAALSEQAIDLLMVAKYFERIGDHAVNIAGWVIFSITGQHGKEK
ncbi:MAG: phosphate signaling complex protein PhoU [Candidatus Howiella sp.]|jgi:phosphate transport system protein